MATCAAITHKEERHLSTEMSNQDPGDLAKPEEAEESEEDQAEGTRGHQRKGWPTSPPSAAPPTARESPSNDTLHSSGGK